MLATKHKKATQAQTGITKGASARTETGRTIHKKLAETEGSQASPPMRACPTAQEGA